MSSDDSDAGKNHYAAGVAAVAREAFTVAETEFRNAIEINPQFAEALRDLGW